MNDKIAISYNTALKCFWDDGYNTEPLLQLADKIIKNLKQPTAGYYYADDVITSMGVIKNET